MLRVTVLGSSAGTPICGNPGSGYLVDDGHTRVVVDMGPGVFGALCDTLSERGLTPASIDAVVISHIHIDHSTDFLALYSWFAYGPSGRLPVRAFVPAGARDHLAAFARAGDDHQFHSVFDFTTVGQGDTASVGGLRLGFAETNHPVPTVATRIDNSEASIAYTSDTGPSPEVALLAAGCDVLLAESTYGGPPEARGYPFHLTATEAGRMAAGAGAGRLVLTHLGFSLDPRLAVAEAAAVFSGDVEVAEPGTEIRI
ncbi:MAG: MBL fold metallo-hydrolase [Acidimicrobiia bacterium]|nr:MBL fold metallo-hydrolase [Acidimicrobiia bacterium]